MSVQTFVHPQPFALEAGAVLPQLQLGYHTWGQLNADRCNVVWVCHALTANSDAQDWWHGLVGPGCVFSPDQYYIVCANMPGSCYGSSGPLSLNPETGQPYYADFPAVTVRDMVRAHQLLATHLGVGRIHVLLGGSMGGQQALEWAVMEPGRHTYLLPIATNAAHSPWGRAFNEAQRMALAADPSLRDPRPDAGQAGMAAARAMGLISYRNYETYCRTQPDTDDSLLEGYRAWSYQQYQGQKLVRRFNAWSYWLLSRAMDSHNLGRGRGGIAAALGQIQARTLVVGISSDQLFPVNEQALLAQHIPGAQLQVIDSPYGHDGFLVEFQTLGELIKAFLQE